MDSDKNKKNIDDLIVDFLRGVIKPDGKEELRKWLACDNSNKVYFRQMYLFWKASAIHYFNASETEKAYQKINLQIGKGKTYELRNDEKLTIKSITVTFRKLAAVIILSFLTGILFYGLLQKSRSVVSGANTQNVINVPLGSKSNITLPDGSEVFLNAGSKLSYTMDYGKKLREVHLVGEGYFKVAKQASKPFIVYTLGANIKALGTEFNVKAYPDENLIETILVKGSVMVYKTNSSEHIVNTRNKKSIVLKQGQKAQIFKAGIAHDNTATVNHKIDKEVDKINNIKENEIDLKVSNTEVETSWKDPKWIIQKEDLSNLFVLFERRYNVIIIAADNDLSKYQFSGTIQNETLEQVLSIVSLTTPISYSIDKGKVEITLNRKLENRYKRAYYKN